MTMHPPTPYLCQESTLYTLQFIAQTDFKGQGHYSKVKGQLKVTP